jgi:hypothetical protein
MIQKEMGARAAGAMAGWLVGCWGLATHAQTLPTTASEPATIADQAPQPETTRTQDQPIE